MDIGRSLLIHLIGRIAVCEKIAFVINGYDVLLDQCMTVIAVIYFDVAGSQIYTKRIHLRSLRIYSSELRSYMISLVVAR